MAAHEDSGSLGKLLYRLAYFQMQKNLLRVFILIALVICPLGALTVQAAKDKSVTSAEKFPALKLKDLQGKDVDLFTRHSGKTLLVNYWATWCPPCLAEIPSLMALKAERQSNSFDVVLISLDFPKDHESLKKLMNRRHLEGIDTLYMSDMAQWGALGSKGLPITVLVSPDGVIMSRMAGGIDWMGPAGTDFLKKMPPNPKSAR